MDRFKEIEAFVLVMEHGSLAAAALHAGITPVMMGRRIDALERRLGTQLIHRSTRRLVLTDQGAGFLDECRVLLAQWTQAEATVSAQKHRASGHLVVSAPAAFGRLHVAPHASAFLKANPEVKLSFNLTDRVVDLVREGYDLGLRIGGAIDPNFVAIKLATNQRVVCGTPAYFRKHGKPRTLDDLDASAINTNFALSAGLNPGKDAISQENAKSPYVNLLAVREQDKDKPWVAKLVKAYHSEEIRKFIQTEFKGSVIPGF